ncbi:hypothetical protein J5N97_022525 [Dioscorea zingiberensis]|uniref:Uncharacterized protein n=1 Tax=Dioscorea zingiberensis TaxID=325984 RepID=A0A9D5HB27_9LILI|nr:hypothetical protein J5N97_022525 [Dioscorea zingiberensis]
MLALRIECSQHSGSPSERSFTVLQNRGVQETMDDFGPGELAGGVAVEDPTKIRRRVLKGIERRSGWRPRSRHSDLNSSTDFEIHYKHGDSVSLTVAESHADFQLLSSNHAQPFNDVYTLVPVPDKFSDDSKPLLSLQVTFFPNSGISISIALHHAACDGPSFMHFFKSWALSYRSEGSVTLFHPPPMFDRSLVNDHHGCLSIFLQDLFSFPAEEAPGSSKLMIWDDLCLCYTPSRFGAHPKFEEDLLHKVLGELTPSSFTVACAYAWVCYVKTRDYSIKESIFLVRSLIVGESRSPGPAAFF